MPWVINMSANFGMGSLGAEERMCGGAVLQRVTPMWVPGKMVKSVCGGTFEK